MPQDALAHDVVCEDLDHDGLPDIYVGVDAESGNKWATSKGGNPLYTRPDGKTWQESQGVGHPHDANCVCVLAADFDNDGDLDLPLINFYSNVVLYRNDNTNDRKLVCVSRPLARRAIPGRHPQASNIREAANRESSSATGRSIWSAGIAAVRRWSADFGLGKTAKRVSRRGGVLGQQDSRGERGM